MEDQQAISVIGCGRENLPWEGRAVDIGLGSDIWASHLFSLGLSCCRKKGLASLCPEGPIQRQRSTAV